MIVGFRRSYMEELFITTKTQRHEENIHKELCVFALKFSLKIKIRQAGWRAEKKMSLKAANAWMRGASKRSLHLI
jgi:hypothetical protein